MSDRSWRWLAIAGVLYGSSGHAHEAGSGEPSSGTMHRVPGPCAATAKSDTPPKPDTSPKPDTPCPSEGALLRLGLGAGYVWSTVHSGPDQLVLRGWAPTLSLGIGHDLSKHFVLGVDLRAQVVPEATVTLDDESVTEGKNWFWQLSATVALGVYTGGGWYFEPAFGLDVARASIDTIGAKPNAGYGPQLAFTAGWDAAVTERWQAGAALRLAYSHLHESTIQNVLALGIELSIASY